MSAVVKLELDNVYSRIGSSLPAVVLSKLSDVCSYNKETYVYGLGKKATKVSLINESTMTFPTGMYRRISNKLVELGYKVKISDERNKPIKDIDKFITAMMKRSSTFNIALRDYQIEGVIEGINESRGLFEWTTGSGKTTLFSFLLLAYDKPALILVNRKELMEQTSRELSEMTGRTVGMIGDSVWQPSKWTVAIVNSLNSGLNSRREGHIIRTKRFLESIEMFIGDEIHHLGAKSWKDIIRSCRNASVRFGFSGTCFHPDSEEIYLVAYTSEVISKIRASDLIKKGWLARPKIFCPKVSSVGASGMDWNSTKKLFIRENKEANESGVKFLLSMYKLGIPSLYFSGEDVVHGKNIKSFLIDAGVDPRDVAFMNGSETTDIRRAALRDIKSGKLKILGGSTIYDEGIDVPIVGAAANFGQGYSEIKVRQRIGRILRKFRKSGDIDVDPTKEQIKYYWDPNNQSNSITRRHSEFRLSIYKTEEGFELHERDFDRKKDYVKS